MDSTEITTKEMTAILLWIYIVSLVVCAIFAFLVERVESFKEVLDEVPIAPYALRYISLIPVLNTGMALTMLLAISEDVINYLRNTDE